MALREILLPWDAQPQEAWDVANWLPAGSIVYMPTAPAVGASVVGSAGTTIYRGGRGLALTGSIAQRIEWPWPFSGRDLTLVAHMRIGSTSPTWTVMGTYRTAAGTDSGHYIAMESGAQLSATSTTSNDWLPAGTSAAVGDVVGVCAVFVHGGGRKLFVNGRLAASSTTARSPTVDTVILGCYSTGSGTRQSPATVDLGIASAMPFAAPDSLAAEISANPWILAEPRRIFVPVSAGGGSFSATGALSSDASTLSGAATHLTLHASSGALSSDASTIAGSATHIVVHPSSGSLSSQDATLAGAALRYRQFSATGALDSDSATIAGDAAHTTTGSFSAVGALSAQDGTIAGTATHLTLHTATGAILASDSIITGTAARLGTHDATGSLLADLASITGDALHTGDGAEVVPLRTGGHAFMRERFAQARKRLALQRILSYLTEEEPAEETKRIIRAVKAGKPVEDKKPPVVMAEVSAEKIADKLIPSRVADLAEIPDIDMQAVIKKAIRLAQERDDEDVLLLL